MVFAKPKQLLSEETFHALTRRVEEVGGRYVNHNTGFEIPKAGLTGTPEVTSSPIKPVGIPEEPASQMGFEPMVPKKNALPRNVLMQDEFKLVPLALISWESPIRDFTGEDVENMAASMMIHGQIQPIVVKPPDAEGSHEGVCGRLRYEGAKHAHRPEVLVRVHNFEDEEEVLEWQLAENLHRKELSALERAQAYGKLAELRKKRFPEEKSVVKGIAMAFEELTGTKPAERTVREYLEIDRKIGKEAKKHGARAPKVGLKHLEQIARVGNELKQAELLERTSRREWSVRKLEQEVDRELGLKLERSIDRSKLEPPKPIDTGLVIACPKCREPYTLIHVEEGSHRLQKIDRSTTVSPSHYARKHLESGKSWV